MLTDLVEKEGTSILRLGLKNNCRSLVLFATACAVVSGGLVLTCESAEAKGKKSTHHKKGRKHGRVLGHNYLVPPPPPYAPSIMPELHMMATRGLPKQAHKEERKDEYPYSKYIFTAKKADAPRSVKLNHTTTVWN